MIQLKLKKKIAKLLGWICFTKFRLNGHIWMQLIYQTVDRRTVRICSCQQFLLDWCETTCNERLCRYNKRSLCLWFSATPNIQHRAHQSTAQHTAHINTRTHAYVYTERSTNNTRFRVSSGYVYVCACVCSHSILHAFIVKHIGSQCNGLWRLLIASKPIDNRTRTAMHLSCISHVNCHLYDMK